MRKLKILGYGKTLGQRKIDFDDSTRYRMSKEQDQMSMAKEAIDLALSMSRIDFEDLDLIVFASAVAYQPIPCSGALVSELYMPKKPIPCMDINTSCTSFVTALDTVSYMIDAKRYDKVLIVSSETASLGLNKSQKESYELFSDGAVAFVFGYDESGDKGIEYAKQSTWPKGAHDTEIRGGLSRMHPRHHNDETRESYLFDMNGPKVLHLVSKTMKTFVKEYEKESSTRLLDHKLVIPHQASRAVPMVMKRIGLSEGQYMDRVSDYGNMIAASIPYMLCLALDEGLLLQGDKVMLLGTAAGLTINGLTLKL